MAGRTATTSRILGFAGGALVCSILLSACGGGIEGSLLDALRTDEHRMLCLSPGVLGIDAFESRDGKRYVAKAGEVSLFATRSSFNALEALRSRGYASDEATSLPKNFASYFDAFELTEKASPFFQADKFTGELDVCIGDKVATEIIEYTEPGEGSGAFTQAKFNYELRFNDMVDELDVAESLRRDLQGNWPGHGNGVFVKTNKGWRVEHAAWQ